MVSDIREKLDAVVGAGGQVLFGPETIPGVGQIGTVMHPVGGVFSFMQPPG
jgi:predicted enzyme related to lactoylglutathione lyase